MNRKLMQRYGDLGLNANNQAISSFYCCDTRVDLRQRAGEALFLVVYVCYAKKTPIICKFIKKALSL